jgi:cytochrome c oxidase subunit II
MVVVCTSVAVGIATFLIYCAIRYHRKNENEMGRPKRYIISAEVAWTVTPFFFFMGMFAWGAKLYFDIERPPDNAIPMYAIGKQWMWKVQHPEGQREINELHIPVGRPVKLTMISQDVIHSFFIPAFRTKQDVLPGRYTTTWFEATKPGKYHLFCAEYCGSKHSGMIGWIYAMNPGDYQTWLTEGAAEGSLASQGEKYFHQFGCANCHHFEGQGRAPNLKELYGRRVEITDGQPVLADETYIRESILDPNAKIVYGFQANVMPNFTGQLNEQQVLALVSYVKALGPQRGTQQPSSSGTAPKAYGEEKGIAGPGASSISGSHVGAR